MIAAIAMGVGCLVVLAFVVGVLDAAQASAWRAIAEQRRELWEAHQLHDGVCPTERWADERTATRAYAASQRQGRRQPGKT